ncbi:hypothetical protein HMPREF9946_04461 [Acetobacteraceae bacterium AT-5844]|nr:hypothetical protein HMPREF9946_04461 [Acetobacteraceae bacterium AT-5844]
MGALLEQKPPELNGQDEWLTCLGRDWREKEFSLQTTLIFFFEFWVGASRPDGDASSAKPKI